jgi:hypothetical protein
MFMSQPVLAAKPLGALRFITIVWLIASCFLVVEWLPIEVLTLGVERGWISDTLVLPKGTVQKRETETGDSQQGSGLSSPTVDARDASVIAWQLGLALGKASVFAQLETANKDVVLRESEKQIRRMANVLGVPVPQRPEIRNLALALSEFSRGLDDDPQRTAAQLAARYSDRHRLLYKLGAFCGYDMIFVSLLRGGESPFTASIRYHAQRAGIPDEVWQPLLAQVPKGGTNAEALELRSRQLARVEEFLKSTQ